MQLYNYETSFVSFCDLHTGCFFSCPQQLNRWPCPLLGPSVCLLPLTIRVTTEYPRDLWPLIHLIRLVDDNFWWHFLMTIFYDNFLWQFFYDNFLWQLLMTIVDDNFLWQLLMTIFDDNYWWQFLMTMFNDNFLWQFVMTIFLWQFVMTIFDDN